ncbi:carboxypeptidase regulatory-like domain-containing protein [Hymenobacter properus]|uniref:Carboxypeptidase regulatory-like domain-containing protein n=1 Tax=Hymenobacter properus TaxID=2791026 RepID=A0A931BFH8_9BACT|nr:carboxypeptidase regulatory-like domain-containing protein [Hymenobacter properus]MBF9141503.1 carboxypeptidase regulatory-like domain-containing protein [Hymenobacter properus]MBR7720312.1 carboxypeptidase regulatory-like domain-containing protein [Microvirga sp. SRT04]
MRGALRLGRKYTVGPALLAGLLLAGAKVRAQAVALSGVVVDAVSGQPVPFAVVEIRARHLGVQTTEQGQFTMDLPTACTTSDSLQVSSLGFAPRVVAVPGVSPCRLALRPLAVALPEAVVRPSTARPVLLGPAGAGDKAGFGGGAGMSAAHSSGWQVARRFTEAPAGTIQAVRFYVKPNPHCGKTSVTAPFRVRLYAADGPNGAPGTDLLTTSVISAAGKAGWHEVNLANYQVAVPTGGFFVAMEWLYTKPDFGCEFHYVTSTKEQKTVSVYGQSLGGYRNATEPPGWYLSAGYPWQTFRALPDHAALGSQSAAIQALVQPN